MTELSSALAGLTTGPVWTAAGNAVDPAGYDHERSGFNLALDHRPGLVLAAESSADVVAGVRFAAQRGLPVDIQATGHGAHRAMTDGLLINTRRLTGVAVDPARRTARVAAGATAADVITAAAHHGLAATVGAAPGVGFVSYSLGGGLGALGRKYGWSADHIRSLRVVTADGRERQITADRDPDLFWGLRGGGGNLAAVTEIEVDLFAVPACYGGGLFFAGDRAGEILGRFRECTQLAPDELSLSVAFVNFPDLPFLPEPIRGRFCAHLRVAHLGGADSAAETERLIAPLREIPAIFDTIRPFPFTEIGSVHADPAAPLPVHSDSLALRTGDALDGLARLLQPTNPFMLEVRHLGGALASPPARANAVGHRAAQYNVFTSAYPGSDPAAAAAAQRRVYDPLASTGLGGPLRTFLPSQYADATSCYEPPIAARLGALKATWDPDNVFAYAPGVVGP
jgi:FAD/FMN-containing dehydrogenase